MGAHGAVNPTAPILFSMLIILEFPSVAPSKLQGQILITKHYNGLKKFHSLKLNNSMEIVISKITFPKILPRCHLKK